ncbi:MAG TPA: glutathionylspermidine synthase family protein [Candidatus Acidoferrum sp.]|nr:glutathionylspermidine synthase family protein [Candidatus Acidoferrum sp.]
MRAIFEHCKWDPQSQDHSVLARYPLFLCSRQLSELRSLAENLSNEALQAESEISRRPDLWPVLGIARRIQRALQSGVSQGATQYVRVMRFDFHLTDLGWRISEVNADVPGGYVEGAGWNSLFAENYLNAQAPPSPSRRLCESIRDRLDAGDVVALVHATTFSDDRQVMMHLAGELGRAGLRPVLAGPENIEWRNDFACLKGETGSVRVNAAIRFFPSEWLPQLRAESQWANWFSDSQTLLCNPGRAILLQSKRFPLVWGDLKTNMDTWRRVLPMTVSPDQVPGNARKDWVIKPAFGRVGEGIGMENVTSNEEFRQLRRLAERTPQEWIAQERFETTPVRTDDGNVYPCVGVFTVNGEFAGIYGRSSRTPLVNQDAQDVAVLVRNDANRGER